MRTDLILALADHMEGIKDPKTYNQDSWFDPSPAGDGTSFIRGEPVSEEVSERHGGKIVRLFPEGFCGATACVLGHAPSVDVIRDAGLFLFDEDPDEADEPGVYDVMKGGVGFIREDGEFFEGMEAAQQAIGLSDQQAIMLFGSSGNLVTRAFYIGEVDPSATWKQVTPQRVAERLRKFVEDPAGETATATIKAEDYYRVR